MIREVSCFYWFIYTCCIKLRSHNQDQRTKWRVKWTFYVEKGGNIRKIRFKLKSTSSTLGKTQRKKEAKIIRLERCVFWLINKKWVRLIAVYEPQNVEWECNWLFDQSLQPEKPLQICYELLHFLLNRVLDLLLVSLNTFMYLITINSRSACNTNTWCSFLYPNDQISDKTCNKHLDGKKVLIKNSKYIFTKF